MMPLSAAGPPVELPITTTGGTDSARPRDLRESNAAILRTQKQMIVQEKLASLGTLTAGIGAVKARTLPPCRAA